MPATTTSTATTVPARAVLDRQVETLLRLGYPALAGVSRADLVAHVEPLRAVADALPDVPETDEPGRASLLLVLGRGRSPLTIEEGVAVVTHAPQLLEKNRCFMLSGSRRGDRRVPAMWISAKAPKLGWCWDGNPHDWLGVASAGARVA